MTEPRRWLDDRRTARELRELLASASAPPPLPAALNAQLSEYAATLAAQGVLAKVGGVSLWQKLVLLGGSSSKAVILVSLVGAVAAGSAGAYAIQRGRALPAPSALARARVQAPEARSLTPPRAPELRAGSPQAAPSSAALAVPGVDRPHQLASAAHDAELAQPAVAASSTESSLVGEAKLLDTARSFLDDSPTLALEVTEQHRRQYPLGQLSAEREFVAIEALLRLGRRQEAERRATPMLNGDRDGLYARRLRRLLSPASSNSENH